MTFYKVIFLAISFYFIALATSLIMYPSGMHSDSGWGFYSMNTLQQMYLSNNEINLHDKGVVEVIQSFAAWWTPGQYLIPFIFIKSLGLSIGHAVTITVILFSLLGIVGFYKLFRLYGFEKNIAILCILIIVLQRQFSLPFSIYNGGEILLFGGVPWCIIAFERLKRLVFLHILILILLSFIGFILKSSYLIILLAMLFYLALDKILLLNNKNKLEIKTISKIIFSKKYLIYIAKIVAIFIITYSTLYYFFIQFGSPSKTTKFDFELVDILVPISSIVFSNLSIDDLLSRIFAFPGSSIITTIYTWYFFLPLALISIYFLYLQSKKLLSSRYTFLFFSFCFLYVFLFTYLYLFNASISYEYRHFRILGILVTPLLVSYIYQINNRIVKYACVGFIFFTCLYGIIGYANRKIGLIRDCVVSERTNITQTGLDKTTLSALHQLDDSLSSGNNLFYFISPEISLEISHNKVVSCHADFEELETIKNNERKGRFDNLYLVLPINFQVIEKETAIRNSFVDYNDFIEISRGEKFKILKGL